MDLLEKIFMTIIGAFATVLLSRFIKYWADKGFPRPKIFKKIWNLLIKGFDRIKIKQFKNRIFILIRNHLRITKLVVIVAIIISIIPKIYFFAENYFYEHPLYEPKLSHILFRFATEDGIVQKKMSCEGGQIDLYSHEFIRSNYLSGKLIFRHFRKSDTCGIWANYKGKKKEKISLEKSDGDFIFEWSKQNNNEIYLSCKVRKDMEPELVKIIIHN